MIFNYFGFVGDVLFLASVANSFHLLNYGLAIILVFIGTKTYLIDSITPDSQLLLQQLLN